MNTQELKDMLSSKPSILRDLLMEIRTAEECAKDIMEKIVDDAFEAIVKKEEKPKYGSTDIR